MVTNHFFQNYDHQNQVNILEDLIIGAIQIYGMDCAYVARTLKNFDKLLGQDDQSEYSDTWMIECYLKSIFGFNGDREFMSKFWGSEIRDQVKFCMARRRFGDVIGKDLGTSRPREGDLLWFPFNERCFQIKYVDQYDSFYQFGTFYTWELTCELFEYSSEVFNTGIPGIDRIQKKGSINVLDYTLRDTDGTPIMTESGDYLTVDGYALEKIVPMTDNKEIQSRSEDLTDWNIADPFSEIGKPAKIV